MTELPSINDVRCYLDYCPETGVVTWVCNTVNTVKPGDRAGTIDSKGYRVIQFAGRRFKEHRIIWAIKTGEWPPDDYQIDHINGIKSDNRWENLRLATMSQNLIGRKLKNVTGLVGVKVSGNKYQASIRDNYKRIYLGSFDTRRRVRPCPARHGG